MGSGGNGVERGKASSFSDERAQPNRHSYNPSLHSFPLTQSHLSMGRMAEAQRKLLEVRCLSGRQLLWS